MFCKTHVHLETSKDWPKNSLVSRKILKIQKEVEPVTVFTLCGQLSKKKKKNACAQYLPRLKITSENSPGVQWLGLRTFAAEGLGSIPGWGTI